MSSHKWCSAQLVIGIYVPPLTLLLHDARHRSHDVLYYAGNYSAALTIFGLSFLSTIVTTATTPQVKTDINPSYDCVTFGTARQPVTTDTIDTNMNYCYSTVPTGMRRK